MKMRRKNAGRERERCQETDSSPRVRVRDAERRRGMQKGGSTRVRDKESERAWRRMSNQAAY